MPYVIRRKSDGKYWRNKDYHTDGHWRVRGIPSEEDPRFVEDINTVKPFMTKGGPKISRCPVDTRTIMPGEKWITIPWEERKALSDKRWDELYEIVSVKIKLEVE